MERLINFFKPANYKLDLNINKETEHVLGHVVITGEQRNEVIKFHSKNLQIKSVKVNGLNPSFVLNQDENILKIATTDFGTTASTIVEIEYEFNLTHNMEGAYVSTYNFENREEKIISTQFESHYAREAFPSIDEPEAKATFDITLTDSDSTDIILCNMPEKFETKTDNFKMVTFETTPKMSTYLVAFVMGHFNKLETTSLHGVKVATYAALNQNISMLKFPNKIAADTLDFYDDLFGIEYPLPKMDQVAIPDFEAGAMENWGLVTYREACLLADDNSPKSVREYVATVITHEFSHQWFGDLVTMRWWNNLWLNESFANMMQYYCADKLYPEWNIWQDFFTDDCVAALTRDALPGVQAVQQDVNDPDEISTLFDGAIVYAKGARLMLMLMRLMGEKAFFAGLRTYFKQHQYGNTSETDLWDALQPHAKFNVAEFMNAWISQPGYPMITDMVQQRFLSTGDTDDTKWPLPEVTDDMSGHYIINLSKPEFDDKLANFDKLSLEQKLRLLIDRELLAKTPIVSSGSLMDMLPSFKNETSQSVFSIVSDIIGMLKVFCSPDTEYYKKYQDFVYSIIEPNLKRLGVKPKLAEDDDDTKLRHMVVGFALYAKNTDVIKSLTDIFDKEVTYKDGSKIHDFSKLNPEIRSAVMSSKMESSHEEVWDEYLEDYKNEADPTIKSQLLSSLSDVETTYCCEKALKLLSEPKIVKPQDHIHLMIALMANFYTRKAAYDWLYKNWDYVESITSDKTMDDYCRVAAAYIRNNEQSDKFFEFFDKKSDNPVLKRTINVAHSQIKAKLDWIQSDEKAVRERLK